MIIGSMKCGTTSLYRYLIQHTAICPCQKKEPEFFSRADPSSLGVSTYEELWDFDVSRHHYALEASTGYTKYPAFAGVPERIHAAGLRPKFLYVVRNPFERIVSHLNFNPQADHGPLKIGDMFPIEVSAYHRQLEQYWAYFPKDDFLVIEFSQLKAEPQLVMERVLAFLGLDGSGIDWEFGVHTKRERTTSIERQLKTPKLRTLWSHVPGPIRRFGKRILHGVQDISQRELSPQERDLIFEQLAPDMQRLHDEYGIEVQQWGF